MTSKLAGDPCHATADRTRLGKINCSEVSCQSGKKPGSGCVVVSMMFAVNSRPGRKSRKNCPACESEKKAFKRASVVKTIAVSAKNTFMRATNHTEYPQSLRRRCSSAQRPPHRRPSSSPVRRDPPQQQSPSGPHPWRASPWQHRPPS